MTLEEKLCKYRKERKLSQADVAEKLNVTRQKVSRWEHGTTVPDIETMKKLAEVYGVSVAEILQQEEEKSIEQPVVQKVKEVSSSKHEDMVALLCGILLLAACQIPIINIVLPIAILIKYKKRKYSFWIKAVAVMCLALAVYNTWIFIDVAFIDNGVVEIKKNIMALL